MSAASPFYDTATLKRIDAWRQNLNPLRHLTVPQVVAWLQQAQLGNVANIQWLYRFVEERYPVLSAVVDRCTAAMEKLDWTVKMLPEADLPEGATVKMAEAQAAALRARYNNIDNLRDAVNALALARFRGYAHLEKHYDENGQEFHLEPVPQYNFSRAGMTGPWFYNQKAAAIPGPMEGEGVPDGLQAIETETFLIREVDRPVDVIAVFPFLREALALKDWSGFLEVFGIPPIFIEMPPDAPADKQEEYQQTAQEVVSDARGTLPAGAKVQTVTASSNGGSPFAEFIRYGTEQVVLKGTGGLLTVLAESGSGTLAGGAHSDSFDNLAEAEALVISEIFQQQFDVPILETEFEGQPKLAWFELAAKELSDSGQVVSDISGLAAAGLQVDADQVQEKTGYNVTLRTPVNATDVTAAKGNATVEDGEEDEDTLPNRAPQSDGRELKKLIATLGSHIDDASDADLAPIFERAQALLDSPDDQFVANAHRFVADIPDLLGKEADTTVVTAWQQGFNAMFFNGFPATPKTPVKAPRTISNRPNPRFRLSNGRKRPLQSVATARQRRSTPQKSKS